MLECINGKIDPKLQKKIEEELKELDKKKNKVGRWN